jgi:hypothetical protein
LYFVLLICKTNFPPILFPESLTPAPEAPGNYAALLFTAGNKYPGSSVGRVTHEDSPLRTLDIGRIFSRNHFITGNKTSPLTV